MSLPRLDRTTASADTALLALPEKAVQFGTGALLRGFIEYFIDGANRAGRFNGRVVAIGSTNSGRDRIFNEQDGLYTLGVRGIDGTRRVNEYQLITSLSRALSGRGEWPAALECARDPQLELIFSNTTETGIQFDEGDEPGPGAPRSFPGKLTRFLYERATAFDFGAHAGVVVLPCELIENNGDTLKAIVLRIAEKWQYDARFAHWVQAHVPFCNTLVDRIVPGEPERADLEATWQQLGYRDELLTVCEVYRLFAIEADEATAKRLTFAASNPDVVIANDIRQYRERKVRLLNGTHTIMVSLAMLAGCETVAEAVADAQVGRYVERVLFGELVPSVDVPDAESFARQVLDRFANPYIRHELADITLQHTMKMRVRIVPAIVDNAEAGRPVPDAIALGFAAYLMGMREPVQRADDRGDAVRGVWREGPDAHIVARRACALVDVWGVDLAAVEGFADAVGDHLEVIMKQGVRSALEQHLGAQQSA